MLMCSRISLETGDRSSHGDHWFPRNLRAETVSTKEKKRVCDPRSDRAIPFHTSSRRTVCHCPSCSPLPSSDPHSVPGDVARWSTSVRAAQSSKIGACKCIYIDVYISGKQIMAIARVFKSGNSQAVRLPKKFRVKSSEVEIFRRGDEIVLREKAGGMVRVLDLLAELPADMFPKKRKDPHPQRRKGL